MSLDVYLILDNPDPTHLVRTTGIYVRENGQTREITRAEWDEKWPGREPYVAGEPGMNEVYETNITHNLTRMADAAGIYTCIWHPDQAGVKRAGQLIELLTAGLERLRADPAWFRTLDPPNGWGSYDTFVPWVEAYLTACVAYPEARVQASG